MIHNIDFWTCAQICSHNDLIWNSYPQSHPITMFSSQPPSNGPAIKTSHKTETMLHLSCLCNERVIPALDSPTKPLANGARSTTFTLPDFLMHFAQQPQPTPPSWDHLQTATGQTNEAHSRFSKCIKKGNFTDSRDSVNLAKRGTEWELKMEAQRFNPLSNKTSWLSLDMRPELGWTGCISRGILTTPWWYHRERNFRSNYVHIYVLHVYLQRMGWNGKMWILIML